MQSMNSTLQSSRRKQETGGPMTLNMLGTKDGLSTMVLTIPTMIMMDVGHMQPLPREVATLGLVMLQTSLL